MIYSYRVEQAIRAAAVLHNGQVRKGVSPYPFITHLVAVAFLLSDYSNDEDTVIAGLLHDTLEDTDYTIEELQEDFGGVVAEIVQALSEPQDSEYEKLTWKEQKVHYAHSLRKTSQEALIVACADKIHNMRTIVEEYYDDHVRFMADFTGSLEDRVLMYQDISNALNRNLKNDIIVEFNHVFEEYKNFVINVKKTKEERERF